MAIQNHTHTVEDVAEMLGLKRKSGHDEWYGANPWGEGASEDGFLLFAEGNAFDRQSNTQYTTPQVAQMAGIPKQSYEPYARYMENNPHSSNGGGSSNKPAPMGRKKAEAKAPAEPKAPKVFNTKTLEERGIKPETLFLFKVTFRNGAYYYPTWLPDGSLGRQRVKYLNPEESFKDKKNKPKYIWKPGDKSPIPPGYNLHNLKGEDTVWLVNGEPSVWVCAQAGMPSIAPLGEGRNKGYRTLFAELHEAGIERVYITLDSDETGRRGTLRALEAAGEFGIEYIVKRLPDVRPGFDVSDFYEQCGFDDALFVKNMETLPVVSPDEIETWKKAEDDEEKKEEEAKKEDEDGSNSRSARLIRLVTEEAELVPGMDGAYYARIEFGNRTEIRPIGDGDFALYLRHRWMQKNKGAVLDATSLTEALESLKAMALFDGDALRPKQEIFVRTAYDNENNLYFDLADDDCNTVQIKDNGTWTITRKPPVNFRRTKGMEALPIPQTGGNFSMLRELLNAEDEAQWVKMAAWAIYASRGPIAPYPVLSVHGERGSAKSTASKLIRSVIDPNFVPMMGASMVDERNLAIAAKNSHIIAFDNMSGMRGDMNDALCSLATEGAMRLRKLRTDDEEMLFKAKRPIIVNGIDDSIGREDFRNRCIPIYLPSIPEENRKEEELVLKAFFHKLPFILGGLMDILAYCHSRVGMAKIKQGPRMMDFAQFIVGGEAACPWKEGIFLPLIMQSTREADVVAMESSLVAAVIQQIMKTRDIVEGSPTDMHRIVNQAAPMNYKNARTWPATPSQLTSQLNRVSPNLRRVGILIDGLNPHERVSGLKGIRIRKEGYNAAAPN